MIDYNNSDWPAVYQNLKKARMRWGIITRVLAETGAMVQARGIMYKAVAQSVLLCGSDSWVMTGEMLNVLEGFQQRATMRITGMTATRGAGGEW